MEFNLNSDIPALFYRPRAHKKPKSRRYILWPSWAYRVIAPNVQQRKINILQKAVMGLLFARVSNAESIAESLAIHKDLVLFIISELNNHGYLDSKAILTQKGKQALDDEFLTTENMVAGYVFQDPWKEDLWPRFVTDLSYAQTELNDEGYPSLVLGTKGKVIKRSAFTVLPRNTVTPSTPSAKSIVEAVRLHKRSLRFKNFDENHEDIELDGDSIDAVVDFNRVSLIEEEPQPVLLITYIYIPDETSGSLDWYVCDPFGLGQSIRLRRKIEDIMHETPGLFENINKIAGETLHGGYEEQKKWLENIKFKAAIEVERRLTVHIQSYKCFEHLVAMEFVHLEVQLLGKDCPDHKINDLLRSGIKILESVFSSMAETHPLGHVWKRVYVENINRKSGKKYLVPITDSVSSAIYEGAILSIGFDKNIPQALLNVKPGQIRSVAEFGDHWRLRPLVTSTALVAQNDTSHPLHSVAKCDSKLLVKINDVANLGGGAGHANSDNVSLDDAETQVNKVYSVVSTLLGLSDLESMDRSKKSGEDNA
jgi:hypothetical protein